VLEFLRRKKFLCRFCGEYFKKGHKCWCPDCKVVHLMCEECYVDCKDEGVIVDKEMNIWDMEEKNKERYS